MVMYLYRLDWLKKALIVLSFFILSPFGLFILIDTNEDEGKQLLHISTSEQIDVVRWNLTNQDEVRTF